jgi:hypothetical protein
MKPSTREIVIKIQSLSVDDATMLLNDFVKGNNVMTLEFPFSSDRFKKEWSVLITEPKWKKKTCNSLQKALIKLSKYSEDIAIQAIEDTIAGNYQGIFPENVKAKSLTFETEAQKRIRQNNNVSEALMNGDLQWKK